MENKPFKEIFVPYNKDEMRVVNVRKCESKFVFHGSAKKLNLIDPSFNRKHVNYKAHEYGVPVIFASIKPSNAFCYEPTEKYKELRHKYGVSVYHRLTHGNHKILLGAKLCGYIYVLPGENFYVIEREDFEVGKWVRITELVSAVPITPIDAIEVVKPYDWEMIPEYEFLGEEYVGEMEAEKYLSLAKDETVKDAIKDVISTDFVPTIPAGLEKCL